MWYKANLDRISSSSTADLFGIGGAREAELVGFLGNIADLPRTSHGALITGASGAREKYGVKAD